MYGNITLISPHENVVILLRLTTVWPYPDILLPSENN